MLCILQTELQWVSRPGLHAVNDQAQRHDSCFVHLGAGMVPYERRKSRLGFKVIHKHRVGDKVLRRVSELVMIEGQPKALLGWINFGGVRTPIFLCDLDLAKLHRSATSANTFYYEEITVDPRFEELAPGQPDDPLQKG